MFKKESKHWENNQMKYWLLKSEGESGSVEMAKSFNKITLLSAIDVHKEKRPKRSYFYDIDDYKKLSNYLIHFYQEFNLIKEKN